VAAEKVLYPDGNPATAYTFSAYGRMMLRLGEFEKSEELQREALAIRRRFHGEKHPDVAYSLGALARVLHERAHYDEAEAHYREALAMHIETSGPRHPIVGNVMNDIGWLLYDRGDYAGAEKMHREAFEFLREVSSGEVNPMATAMLRRAADFAALGRLAEADSLAVAGVALSRRLHGDRTTWVAGGMTALAEIRLQRGAVADAETLFAGATERMRLSAEDTTLRPRDARALIGVGRCRLAAGDIAGAEQRFREALEIERKYRRASHPDVARAEIALASALVARGDLRAAERLLRSAEETLSPIVAAGQIDRREADALLRKCR
jgi:tetratricopeptide (TPR) repeat protein